MWNGWVGLCSHRDGGEDVRCEGWRGRGVKGGVRGTQQQQTAYGGHNSQVLGPYENKA